MPACAYCGEECDCDFPLFDGAGLDDPSYYCSPRHRKYAEAGLDDFCDADEYEEADQL